MDEDSPAPSLRDIAHDLLDQLARCEEDFLDLTLAGPERERAGEELRRRVETYRRAIDRASDDDTR